jgi:GNAT superfamily N-acetyltransferase
MKIWRILKMAKVENLTFENNHINFHNAQNDYNLLAKLNGKSVGMIEYSEYMDEIYINHIVVSPNLRRQGIATQMIEELKRLYPSEPIHWGIMSEEGSKLNESLKSKKIIGDSVNPKWYEDKDENMEAVG